LEIQKARFEASLGIAVNANPDVLHALVPTFILQPLVEATILHGTSDLRESRVEIRAWQDSGHLRLSIRDESRTLEREASGIGGIGISNTRERLKRMYGDREQMFEVVSEPGKGVRLDLSIPFREG
jgi:LytS/YehU family sensor histidine kinase